MLQFCVRLSVCRLWRYVLWLNGASYSKSYYWQPIGSRIWEIDWYQNEWPWSLFRGRIKSCHSPLNISELAVRDRGLVPKNHQQEMAYGKSNGHVTDDVTWHWKVKLRAQYLENSWRYYLAKTVNYYIVCCKAAWSAILAIAWLLVYVYTIATC